MTPLPDSVPLKLLSLVRRSAELYRLLLKSSEAPDSLTSDFLQSKKHLKRAERRFISGLTHAALRMKSLLEHCVSHALSLQGIEPVPEEKFRELLMYTAMLIGPETRAYQTSDQLAELSEFHLAPAQDAVDALVREALNSPLSWNDRFAGEFCSLIRQSFETICNARMDADGVAKKRRAIRERSRRLLRCMHEKRAGGYSHQRNASDS